MNAPGTFAHRELRRIRESVAHGNANSLQGIRDAWQARREREARRERRARLAWWVIGSALLPCLFIVATN